jgi:hypothetical protein
MNLSERLWRMGGIDTHLSALFLIFATGLLGRALQETNGTLSPNSIRDLTIVLVLGVLAVVSFRIPIIEENGSGAAVVLAAGVLVFDFAIHFTTAPGVYLRGPDFVPHHEKMAFAAVLSGLLLAAPAKWSKIGLVLLVGIYFSLGIWMLTASPTPTIDVWYFHQAAFDAVKNGTASPWGITIPNIYGHTLWYADGWATNERVNVGLPYPLLSFLLTWVGHAFTQDFRYANLVAMAGAALLLGFSNREKYGVIAAMLLLFTPREFFVLEQSWTEPLVIFFLAATVFAMNRWPRLTPWAFGLGLAVKQYVVFVVPLFSLLTGGPQLKPRVRAVLISVGIAVVFTLAALAWDAPGFIRSVIVLQGAQPFRTESMSYIAWFAKEGKPTLPLWLAFAVIPVAYTVAIFRAPRSPFGFAASSALLFTLFFAFAKQAFCNYYFLVIGCFCCAIAVVNPQLLSEERVHETNS